MDNCLHLEHRHIREILRISRVRDVNGETVLNIDSSLPPRGSLPPLHVHVHQSEESVVKAGSLGAQIGNKKMVLRTGEKAAIPARVAHTTWNAGDDTLELSGRAIPAGDFDRYLQALFAVFNASPSGKPSIFYLVHVLWRHRHTQAIQSPPPSIQRIVFPAILFVGRVLGKYKGENWPGSPASCPGAPLV